jgi:hypothetical protein
MWHESEYYVKLVLNECIMCAEFICEKYAEY